MVRILFVSQTCYLDTHNGASVATRAMLEGLARRGHPVAAMCSAVFEAQSEVDPFHWLSTQGLQAATIPDPAGSSTATSAEWRALRRAPRGVDVLIHRSPASRPHLPDADETREFRFFRLKRAGS